MGFKKLLLGIVIVFYGILANEKAATAQGSVAIKYGTPKPFIVGSTILPLLPVLTGEPLTTSNSLQKFADLTTPFCIASDASNNIYTTNNSSGELSKFNSAGIHLFTVSTGDSQASGVAVDHLGNIYVSQFTQNIVLKFNSSGTLISAISGFSDPYGIAFDSSNNAYVADFFSGNILKISAGADTSSVYITGFDKPYGIAIDAAGNMYVGEEALGDIIKVKQGTSVKEIFAKGFSGPRHLCKDSLGNIYVADYGNNSIKKVTQDGKQTTIISAGLSSPRQVAFDSSGNLFIANYDLNTLVKLPCVKLPLYSINKPLPTGLVFDTTTGQISGIPLKPSISTVYTISASTANWSVSTQLTLTVNSNITLQPESVSTMLATEITGTSATLNGAVNNKRATTLINCTYATDSKVLTGTKTVTATDSSSNSPNATNYSFALKGLKSATTYYYYTSAVDSGRTIHGNVISFCTLPSSTSVLSNLVSNYGSINPAFVAGTYIYSTTVTDSTENITFKPTLLDSNASITYNGSTLQNGQFSVPLPLKSGDNIFSIMVTAQDGKTSSTYTIKVTRPAGPQIALSGLTLTNAQLNEGFSSGTLNYTSVVNNGVTSVEIKPIANGMNSMVTVNGTEVNSGGSVPVTLKPGSNLIIVTVATKDNKSKSTYTINVTRLPSADANLLSLTFSNAKNTKVLIITSETIYNEYAEHAIEFVNIRPLLSDGSATLTINGNSLVNDMLSPAISLETGKNTITVVVTAPDKKTKKTYIVYINRYPAPQGA